MTQRGKEGPILTRPSVSLKYVVHAGQTGMGRDRQARQVVGANLRIVRQLVVKWQLQVRKLGLGGDEEDMSGTGEESKHPTLRKQKKNRGHARIEGRMS